MHFSNCFKLCLRVPSIFTPRRTSGSSSSLGVSTSSSSDLKGVKEESIDEEETNSDSIVPQVSNVKKPFSMKNVRQHVNPLSEVNQQPIQLPDNWIESYFARSELPMILDVGSAKGTWVLESAGHHLDKNYLGLEIRKPVVDYANLRRGKRELKNAHFLQSNANIDVDRLMSDLNEKEINIEMICIHHPDPHFKKRHKKRRVVTDEFVNIVAKQTKQHHNIM